MRWTLDVKYKVQVVILSTNNTPNHDHHKWHGTTGLYHKCFFSEEQFWLYPKFGINVNSSRTLRTEQINSEIDELNFIDKTAIEKVHLGFCKSILVEVKKELHQFSCSSRTWSTAIIIFYKNSDFFISSQT
jgi:hypothetical protein